MERKSNRTIFRGLFQRRDSQKVGKAPGARKLRVEGLEERRLLSASDWGGEGVFENAAIVALASDEIASAEISLQRETVEIETLATAGTYNQHDLSIIYALGLTEESEGVVWNSEGRLVELTYANPEVTSIEIKGCSVLSSLDVSRCANLTSLDCSQNQLTTLDISGCVNLDRLDCRENALSNLDLSHCSNLTVLYCQINSLSELNVSNCAKLLRFDCYMNNLSQLDISALVDLSHFECYLNNLTSLDVSNSPRLYFLNCEKNQISELDVSNLTNLHRLSCSYNQIERLDLSNCPDLNIVSCFNNQLSELLAPNCGSLWTLNCGNNRLTELDLSGCTELSYLGCNGNKLTILDFSQNVYIQNIICYYNNLLELNVEGCASLQTLECFSNQLSYLDISDCNNLQSLDCHDNNLQELILPNCLNLLSLKCHNNKLSDLDVSSFVNLELLYCENNLLSSLDLSNNQYLTNLSCNCETMISLDVSGCRKLKILYFSGKSLVTLNASGCENLTDLTCYNNKIENLCLSGCTNLEWLICSMNQLEELDLKDCGKLQYLDCVGNKLKSLDVVECLDLYALYCDNNALDTVNISPHPSLQFVSCSNNKLINLEVSDCVNLQRLNCCKNELVELEIVNCPNLTYMECYNNHLITLEIDNCQHLESIICAYNKLTALNIRNSPNIRGIYCYVNNLTEINLSSIPNIVSLNCAENNISQLDLSMCSQLTMFDCRFNSLTELDISSCPNLNSLSFDSSLERITMGNVVTTKVTIRRVNGVEELVVIDGSGQILETTEGLQEVISFNIQANATNPITIAYFKNGEVVGTTKINEIVLTPPILAGSVTNTAIVVKINPVEDAERYVLEYDTDPNFSEPRTKTYTTTGAKTITGLTPGTPYYVRVKAIATNADDSAWSTLRLVPGAPTLASPKFVASATKTTLIVNIGAVENAESYVLEYSENPDFSDSVTKTYRTSGARTFTNLPFGKTYYFRVKATSESCNDSKWSQLAFATGQLSGTTLKVASVNYDRVELTVAKVDKAVGCAIEYSKSADFSDSTLVYFSTFGTKTISGLDENATYYFRAKALGDGTNRVDSAWTSTITRKTAEYLGALSAPSVVALSATKNALVLKFTGVPNGAKYVVEYGTDPTFAGCATKTYPSSGSKTITGLAAGTTYYLRLKAIATGYADSDWVQATATTKGAPASSAILDLDAAFEDYFDDELALI